MDGIIPYALLNRKIKGLASGISNITYNSTTLSLEFTCTNGTVINVPVPNPLTAQEVKFVKDLYTKSVLNTTTGDFEYNGVPLNNIVFDKLASFPTVGNEKKLYLDTDKNKLYKWDSSTSKYILLSGGGSSLGKDVTSSIAVGGISANTKFVSGTSYDDMWEALLNPYQKPVINSFTLNPNTTTYEIGTLITNLTLNTSIAKKSKPITFVKFYEGTTLLDTKTGTTVENGGSFSYAHTLNNDDTNTTYKVECSDGDNTVNKTTTIKFERKTFYGTDSANTAPYTTSAEVRALTGTKLGAKGGDTFSISIPVGTKKVVIAIPNTLSVSSVKYVEGLNAEVKNVFSVSTVNVEGNNNYTGIDYKVYEYVPVAPFSAVCTYNVTL